MNAIKNKIQSSKGASITFALLIFLVCAVVSSVVIVAGTAAAGRMSKLPQSDQRYYAVTSAAGLLRDEISGKRVTVQYETDDKGVLLGDITETKIEKKDPSGVFSPGVILQHPLVIEVTKSLVKVIENSTSGAAGSTSTPDAIFSVIGSSTGSGDGTTEDCSFLNCEIKEYAKTDGRVVFEIRNTPAEGAKDKSVYIIQVEFNANINKSVVEAKTVDKSDDLTEASKKNIVTTTIAWKFSGTRKGAVPGTEG